MSLGTSLLFVNAAATFFMLGVIWYVQLVQYPLFAKIPSDAFHAFHAMHMARTSWVVILPMCVELVTAGALVLEPSGLSSREAWLGAGLVAAIWASTFFLQVPQHQQLEKAFDHAVVDALVQGNWIRTALWSARAGLCVMALARWARL